MSTIQDDILDAFHFYDSKGDKKIAASQVGNCLRSLNLQPSEAQVEKVTQQWKNAPDSRVSIEEFTPIYTSLKKEAGKSNGSVDMFQALMSHYDRDGNGTMHLVDIRFMLTNYGEKMAPNEVDAILNGLDVAEGKVTAAQLINTVMSL